jgi:hypothetical protein
VRLVVEEPLAGQPGIGCLLGVSPGRVRPLE